MSPTVLTPRLASRMLDIHWDRVRYHQIPHGSLLEEALESFRREAGFKRVKAPGMQGLYERRRDSDWLD